MQETNSKNDEEDASEVESCFVWFQSSPLAFENGPTAHYLKPLDIQQEQEVIQRVFDEAPSYVGRKRRRQQQQKPRVHFEIGTPRQLGSFLQLVRNQPNHCISLHISCHARPNYLAFEDGWGTALPITIQHLETLLQSHRSGGESFASVFQLIFIAACKSRSIGEALRNAGATNIICAHSDQTDMNVSYVLEFSKVMYSTFLSCESVSVKDAYDRAMHEVSLYPSYRDLPPQLCLLSDEQENKSSSSCSTCKGTHGRLPIQEHSKRCAFYSNFPKPPSYFSRQDTEVWKVLQLVKDTQDENARILWVTGQDNDELGMKCTIQSACQCLEQRLEANSIEGIAWMELRVHPSLCSGTFDVPLSQVTHRITKTLQDRNMILVLDATKLGYESVPLLVDKISTLIETTQHLKFIIINSEPLHLTWNCEDRHISIPALGLESTIKIFGKLCRHVKEERVPGISCSTTLWDELVRGMNVATGEQDSSDNKSNLLAHSRYRVLYNALGKGKLNNVVNVARTMSQEEFLQCVSLGYKSKALDALHSRYLLLKYSHSLQCSIFQALQDEQQQHLEQVKGLQERLDTVALVLHEVPSMTELWTKLDSVSNRLHKELYYHHHQLPPRFAKRNNTEVSKLKEEEQDIKRQIQLAACFRVQHPQDFFTVADLDVCTKKERELEMIVDFTNDLLFQFQMIHDDQEEEEGEEGDDFVEDKQALLVASLANGSDNIATMQLCVEQGLHRPQSAIFNSLECLPLAPNHVDCDHYLKTRRMEKRLKSATMIQARVRGMQSRMEYEERNKLKEISNNKNNFLLNVQKMMQGSLQRISCRRVVPEEEEQEEDENQKNEMMEQDEVMTQASTIVSGVAEDYFSKRGGAAVDDNFKNKGVLMDDLLTHSIHTATTAPLSELSHSAHRSLHGSIHGGLSNFVRQVSFRVQDRWKTGVPQREFLFSKTFNVKKASGEEEQEDEQQDGSNKGGSSRWDSGTPRREVMLPLSFR